MRNTRPSQADGGTVDAARPPRILIARLSAIGDVIHGLPVLCALRAGLPHAYLGWVAEGRAGDLLVQQAQLGDLVGVHRRLLGRTTEISVNQPVSRDWPIG